VVPPTARLALRLTGRPGEIGLQEAWRHQFGTPIRRVLWISGTSRAGR
jgi:hypothetical protein